MTMMLKTRISAIRDRATARAADYTITNTDAAYLSRWYTVAHNTDADRVYQVDRFMKTCDCEAFEKEGYCKHYAMVQERRHEEETVADYEDLM